MNNRILYIDLLKTFAIYLVIYGHAIMHYQPDYEDSICFNIIHSFHMPLFMMLSGYFATSSMAINIKTFLCKKFRQLLLPCLSWGIICWLFVTRGLIESKFSLEINNLFTGWLGLFYNFWFLKSCFICYVLAWICKKTGKYEYAAFACTWLLCSMQGYFNLSVMFPSFLFGMKLRENVTFSHNLYKYHLLIASLFLGVLFYKIYSSDNQYIIKLVVGISGAYTCFSLFLKEKLMLQHVPSIFYRIGETTLGIYILQAITLEYILPRYIQIDFLPSVIIPIIMPVISILLLFVYYWIVRHITMSRTLAFLLLGKNYK